MGWMWNLIRAKRDPRPKSAHEDLRETFGEAITDLQNRGTNTRTVADKLPDGTPYTIVVMLGTDSERLFDLMRRHMNVKEQYPR